MRNIEICLDTTNARQFEENLSIAIDCGVKRLELCSNMQEDGLTPEMSAVENASNFIAGRRFFSSVTRPEVVVMIRLHNKDFTATTRQLDTMLVQIRKASEAGAQGVVFGVLNQKQTVDVCAMKCLCDEAKSLRLNITLHRAFDALTDCSMNVSSVLELGVHRILSSGTPWSSQHKATMGLTKLKNTLSKLPENAQLVVGGGVNAENACILESNLIKVAKNTNQLWLHAYSGVLSNHRLCPTLTRQLVNSLV